MIENSAQESTWNQMSRVYLDVTLLAITYSFPILHICYSNANISLKATLETPNMSETIPFLLVQEWILQKNTLSKLYC